MSEYIQIATVYAVGKESGFGLDERILCDG